MVAKKRKRINTVAKGKRIERKIKEILLKKGAIVQQATHQKFQQKDLWENLFDIHAIFPKPKHYHLYIASRCSSLQKWKKEKIVNWFKPYFTHGSDRCEVWIWLQKKKIFKVIKL